MGNSFDAISSPINNNSFANDLFKVISQSSEENVFFSPFSIAAVIAMLHMGSKGNTEKQIMTGMHLPEDKELIKKTFHDILTDYKSCWNRYKLHTSNLIYIQKKFQVKGEFLNSLKYFLSSIKKVNFDEAQKIANEVNNIVERETKSKIKNIVSPDSFNADTILVLVNAIYFKANWDVKLKITDFPLVFWNSDSQCVDVEMMSKESKYRYQPDLKGLDARLLALNYKGSRMCFVILLPNKKDGLGNLEEKLKSVDLGELDKDAVSTKVKLFLPKFKLEETVNLNSVLENLGMVDMFNKDICDLSGISPEPEAFVSNIIHKAFLDVNEVGCEAAAATASALEENCVKIETPTFMVNHPFVFFIKDRKFNIILFMGKVVRL